MTIKAVLAVPEWLCFAGNHRPVVRVGGAFVQMDFELFAHSICVGGGLVLWAAFYVVAYGLLYGSWSGLWMVPVVFCGVVWALVFPVTNSMRMAGARAVRLALPVTYVETPDYALPESLLIELDGSQRDAIGLMREVMKLGDHMPVRRWMGFGVIAGDIVARVAEPDYTDWARRRMAHEEAAADLQRRMLAFA